MTMRRERCREGETGILHLPSSRASCYAPPHACHARGVQRVKTLREKRHLQPAGCVAPRAARATAAGRSGRMVTWTHARTRACQMGCHQTRGARDGAASSTPGPWSASSRRPGRRERSGSPWGMRLPISFANKRVCVRLSRVSKNLGRVARRRAPKSKAAAATPRPPRPLARSLALPSRSPRRRAAQKRRRTHPRSACSRRSPPCAAQRRSGRRGSRPRAPSPARRWGRRARTACSRCRCRKSSRRGTWKPRCGRPPSAWPAHAPGRQPGWRGASGSGRRGREKAAAPKFGQKQSAAFAAQGRRAGAQARIAAPVCRRGRPRRAATGQGSWPRRGRGLCEGGLAPLISRTAQPRRPLAPQLAPTRAAAHPGRRGPAGGDAHGAGACAGAVQPNP